MSKNDSTNAYEKAIPLSDKKENGEERPWRSKKIANVSYSELLSILEFKKAERVSLCGDILEFNVNDEGRLKLAKAWFCKSPLCPMCNWRKAMKNSIQTRKIVTEVVRRKPTARWLFLTLTLKNAIDGEHLDKSLREMAVGFNRLMKYKKVKQNMVGFMRATEVTVNEENGSYNQHMHVLLCVESMYFKNTENYITQKQWTSLWQKAMKLDYIPTVHIEAVKAKSKKTDVDAMRDAVNETAKYSVKSSDYLTGNLQNDLEVVKDLEQGLYRKRLIAYGGLLKTIHKELNLSDVEDGDLVHIDDEKEEENETAYKIVALWNWRQENYFLKKGL